MYHTAHFPIPTPISSQTPPNDYDNGYNHLFNYVIIISLYRIIS